MGGYLYILLYVEHLAGRVNISTHKRYVLLQLQNF